MKNQDKILTEKQQKCHRYYQVKLINMNILQVNILLPFNQRKMKKQFNFTYALPVKVFEKQIKTTEYQKKNK